MLKVNEILYPNISEAAKVYNISSQTARKWLETNTNNWIYNDPKQVIEQKLKRSPAKAVKVSENFLFESISEAARHFGIHQGSVKKFIKSFNFPDW